MNRGRFRGNRSNRNDQKDDSKTVAAVDENKPVIRSFRQYAAELSEKHDRYERIVKLSRDITIESKRLIFLLHTIDARKPNNQKILDDTFTRLQNLCAVNFLGIAKELSTLDPYQYARAFSAGLQEFVEAFTFYNYLCNEQVLSWNELQEKLTFAVDANGENADANGVKVSCLVQPMEFMLGLADLSGEIMRKCINSLGAGDIQGCNDACAFVQKMYSGYLSLVSVRNRDLSHKFYTMHQSLLKVEKVCYNVKIRGNEAAKWSASETMDKNRSEHEDEGFINY